jgi:hypothetical protein
MKNTLTLVRVILGALLCGFASQALGKEYPDIGPETPYRLTKAEATQLVEPGKVWFSEGSVYNCDGFGVSVTKLTRTKLSFEIRAGEKMNLGSSVTNLAGWHGGRFSLEVEAVLDENGNDILNRKNEKEWSALVNPTKFENGYYIQTRSFALSPKTDPVIVKSVKFKAKLALPVEWQEFTFAVGPVKSSVHPLIAKVEADNSGVKLNHPAPLTNAVFFVYGMDEAGKKLLVSSKGFAGTVEDNHWFYFNSGQRTAKQIHVLMSVEKVEKDILFSIVPPAIEPAPVNVNLDRAVFADSILSTPKYVFVLGGVAYPTVDELKKGIDKLTKGSRIKWSPSVFVYGNEPLGTEAEVSEFQAYCKERGLRLTIETSRD